MAVRSFNVPGDRLTLALGNIDTQTAFSAVFVVKAAGGGTDFDGFLWHTPNSEAGPGFRFYWRRDVNRIALYNGAASAESTTDFFTEAMGWSGVGVSKAAGTATVRMHRYSFSLDSFAHEDSAALGDHADVATKLVVGYTGGDWFCGLMAVGAVWEAGLSDGGFEACFANHQTADIFGQSPGALWDFNQASTTDSVLDLVGGANEVGLVGTSVVAGDDPGGDWVFGTGVPAPSLSVVRGPRRL